MLSVNKWMNKLRRATGNDKAPPSLAMGTDIREFPETAEQACKELQQLVDSEMARYGVNRVFFTHGSRRYAMRRSKAFSKPCH